MKRRHTSLSFHVNRPSHPWDKAISNSDHQTWRSRSWVWSKGKIIRLAQYLINSLPFHFIPIKPTIPEIHLFRNLTLKNPTSMSWVRSKVKVTLYTQYPTNALPVRFISIGPTIPVMWPKECLTLKQHIQKFLKTIRQKRFPTEFLQNQALSMTRRINLTSFVLIGWMVLTLSCGQANIC